MKSLRLSDLRRRDFWTTVAPAALLVLAAFAVAVHFIQPAPPRKLVMATGSGEGGYRFFFRRYQAFLKNHGVDLQARDSAGGLENLKLLSDPASGVDVAFLQAGIAPDDSTGLVSLGALYYQPLWVFYRGDPVEDLAGLRGKRIAAGAEEGGTYALAMQLLEANGAAQPPTEVMRLSRSEATRMLKEGALDALFLISPAESPAIKRLAMTPGVRLLSFARAEAYERRFPFLKRLVLPRGVLDLAADVPAADTTLLAPTAHLVAREALHPALAFLLMRAASEIHSGAGLLDRAGEFPAPLESGIPLSPEARRYYKSGAPLLQRSLPFWAASLIERLWVLLVPLLAVLVPVFKLIPPLYRWRVRSRIYRWYGRLKELELELEDRLDAARLQSMLARLDDIEHAIGMVSVPLSYSENLYSFRVHIDLVRSRVRAGLRAHGMAEVPGGREAG